MPFQVVYKEEDLERSSRRNDERRAQEDTTGSRRMKPGLLIDEAKEKQIKEKMMSSQSPKLRIPRYPAVCREDPTVRCHSHTITVNTAEGLTLTNTS